MAGELPLWARDPYALLYKELPGAIGERALMEHYALYQGYVSKVRTVQEGLMQLISLDPDVESLAFRGLKFEGASALAGALLHELFFDGLTDQPGQLPVTSPLISEIVTEWGSIEGWWEEMSKAAMSCKGWATLNVHGDELVIEVQDDHNGSVPTLQPICVIDCYEHAYWMDYGTSKATYLDGLFQWLNWNVMSVRYANAIGATYAR